MIGIPATLDNDVPMSEMALGVDTAANTLTRALGQLAGERMSAHRVIVVEVIGRNSGELARLAALASGAEIVVTPERGFLTMDRIGAIAARLEGALRGGRQAMVLVAEGVSLDPALGTDAEANPTMRLASTLQAHFRRQESPFPGLEARACVLGGLERGGPPSAADRILAARFAEAAWEVITSPNEPSGVLGLRNGAMLLQDFDVPIDPDAHRERPQVLSASERRE